MTPEQLAARIGVLAGRDVRLRPDPERAPQVWVGVLRGCEAAAGQVAGRLDGVAAEADGDRLLVRFTDEQVAEALEAAAGLDTRSLRSRLAFDTPLVPRGHSGRRSTSVEGGELVLTRDGGRATTYEALADEVGAVSARWAYFRASDGRQIDCAATDLATLTPRNPVLPVLLATSRLRGTPRGEPPGLLAALIAEWPLVLADAQRTGRSRPVALHLERLAEQVLRWSEAGLDTGSASASPHSTSVGGGAPAVWTGERLARTGRIVLVAGLAMAGIPEPTRI